MEEKPKDILPDYFQALNEFQRVAKPILGEIKTQIATHIAPLAIGLNAILRDNEKQIKSFGLGLKSLGVSLAPTILKLSQNIQLLPTRTKVAVEKLGENGWYMDTEMGISDLISVGKALDEGNIQEAEEFLVDYYKSILDEAEERICKDFPHRSKIIRSAFGAHRKEEYELSVPVLLTQADGICHDIINKSLFRRRRKDNMPATTEFVEKFGNDQFWSIFLAPLTMYLPISANEKERKPNFKDLNRHQVLHGEVVDYGTEINSLKSISLVVYLTGVLKDEDLNAGPKIEDRQNST